MEKSCMSWSAFAFPCINPHFWRIRIFKQVIWYSACSDMQSLAKVTYVICLMSFCFSICIYIFRPNHAAFGCHCSVFVSYYSIIQRVNFPGGKMNDTKYDGSALCLSLQLCRNVRLSGVLHVGFWLTHWDQVKPVAVWQMVSKCREMYFIVYFCCVWFKYHWIHARVFS